LAVNRRFRPEVLTSKLPGCPMAGKMRDVRGISVLPPTPVAKCNAACINRWIKAYVPAYWVIGSKVRASLMQCTFVPAIFDIKQEAS
jgi:hypothetical protein